MVHSAPLYPGVCAVISLGVKVGYTAKFRKWAEDTLEGKYSVGIINANAYCLIFDSQEDLVAYQLVWDSSTEKAHVDVAGFYCPYVPSTLAQIASQNHGGDIHE